MRRWDVDRCSDRTARCRIAIAGDEVDRLGERVRRAQPQKPGRRALVNRRIVVAKCGEQGRLGRRIGELAERPHRSTAHATRIIARERNELGGRHRAVQQARDLGTGFTRARIRCGQ